VAVVAWGFAAVAALQSAEPTAAQAELLESKIRPVLASIGAANAGEYCQVLVRATYLKDLLYEDFLFDEEDWLQLTSNERQ